jgi:hypothetical protein
VEAQQLIKSARGGDDANDDKATGKQVARTPPLMLCGTKTDED